MSDCTTKSYNGFQAIYCSAVHPEPKECNWLSLIEVQLVKISVRGDDIVHLESTLGLTSLFHSTPYILHGNECAFTASGPILLRKNENLLRIFCLHGCGTRLS